MAELNSAHTAANGLNFDSLGKRRIKVLCHHIFHVTHGRNVVTTRRKEKLLQSSFLHNFRKFSIENRTLKCKRDGLKCVEDTFRPMHYGSISSINDLKYLKM